IDPGRVQEISSWLTEQPVFFTPPFSDRAHWEKKATERDIESLVQSADELLESPTPELSAELFAYYAQTGKRADYEKPFSERTHRLNIFLFAEGFQNNGKYLSAIEKEISAILSEPTWSSPAHVAGEPD